jgi:hypothetical protein
MDQLEEQRGIQGLREHLLPLVEDAIQNTFPSSPVLTKEALAFVRVLRLNGGGF